MGERWRDDRAVSPVVGKTLELGIVVLFVGLMTTTLYGGIVPDYRTSAGAEVGDRTLVTAAERIETSIPPNATAVHGETRIDLPRTIRGEQYELHTTNGTLVLDHPLAEIGGRTPLALPDAVVDISGTWRSGDDLLVVVDGTPRGLTVELEGST
ncbi:hypothetical protein SAMN04487950_1854 [Halogranum rubrum]|uniref:Flagellin N-terminal-like domain-containing protein n=2 Tax=Halogranum rubrum TaxID=553466 RepID=A0A1I4E2N6_9EURY|nr:MULTISPECIES: hypothetical protein [Halogranum]EJN60796.1 hypothetical protein HSB1_13990 [Halogranum salarium B-1]SFL00035.1 hypothetical protein SAMN04487950_1854 [Halogranum rubrum]